MTMPLLSRLPFAAIALATVGACGEISTVGGTSAPAPQADAGTVDSGVIGPDSGSVGPTRCSNLGERAGTQVTVVEEGFAPVAFSVAENCAGIHIITAATAVACPYAGCAVAGGLSGKDIDAFGATGYAILSAGGRVYVARSGDPATRTAGVFVTSMDLQEPWQTVSERPTQTPFLRRVYGRAVGEYSDPANGYVNAVRYPTEAGGVEEALAGDYGGAFGEHRTAHLAHALTTRTNGQTFYRGHAQIPILLEFLPAPATSKGVGGRRLAFATELLATDTRIVAITQTGESFGVLSCPDTSLDCRANVTDGGPIARGVFGPFFGAHGRVYALRAIAGRPQVIYWDDAALAASELTGTLLGDPLPFANVYDFDADGDHLYVRGGNSPATTSVIRIAK
jgi:hypothetical protein